jgi:hypothetical protein
LKKQAATLDGGGVQAAAGIRAMSELPVFDDTRTMDGGRWALF